MKRVKEFFKHRPVVFGFALIIMYILGAIVSYPIQYFLPSEEPYLLYGEALSKLVVFGLFFLMLWRFGWLRISGITKLGSRKIWLIAVIVLCYKVLIELYAFTGQIRFTVTDVTVIFSNLLYYFTASAVEEIMYRALILTAMILAWENTKYGVLKAILFSSLLFGFIHLLNISVDPVDEVVVQSIVVVLPGIFYAVIVLLSRSLWPAIFIHWITNAAVNIQLTETTSQQISTYNWIIYALLLLPLIIYSSVLVMKSDLVNEVNARLKLNSAYKSTTITFSKPKK